MGEVYRARDSKLGRDVAIKILPSHFTADPERRARFAREARLLATLNHPHIGAIYGLEESNGLTALVLELVEGPTLADRLERGPLKLAEALTIARQVAEALDAAHEKGIVHRDLKPANIVLQGAADRTSGYVCAKVLDFGLAKALTGPGPGDATIGNDESLSGTADGRILGTPAYMSPEQARGQTVDKRTDIWAFGCVLFEMLTGRRPFEGEAITDTFARILEREPEWSALPATTPTHVRRLLERCLRKDPRKRLRDIGDVVIEIDDDARPIAPSISLTAVDAGGRRRNRRWPLWTASALVAGVLLTVAGTLFRRQQPVQDALGSLELDVTAPAASRFARPGPGAHFALAPDGSRIALVVSTGNGPPVLWLRPLGTKDEGHQLPGTEGAENPFWSPNSKHIGFFAGNKLKKIDVNGGGPIDICDAVMAPRNGGGSWNQEGVILFTSAEGRLQKVSSEGGTPIAVTELQETDASHRWPWFLPDGQHFLFLASVKTGDARGDTQGRLHLGSLASTGSTPLGTIRTSALYASGYLLFVNETLMAQPFDVRSRTLTGDAVPLKVRLAVSLGRIGASISETGLLALFEPALNQAELTWIDRKGHPMGTVGEPRSYVNLALNPDDRRVAVSSRGDNNIWVIDLTRGGDGRPITSDPALDRDPVWSPDGKDIIFNSLRDGSWSLFRRPADGSGIDRLVARAERGRVYTSPDWSLVGGSVISGAGDLWLHSPDGASHSSAFVATPQTENSPSFSPDGRFIVYSSDLTGRWEIYVRPFASREPEEKVSRDGGWFPRWRSPGEIVFLSLDGTMMSARVSIGKTIQVQTVEPLFRTSLTELGRIQKPYDVSKDGQRFLIPVAPAGSESLTVVTNWTARLSK
jgi:Tol biopolymer transport system component